MCIYCGTNKYRKIYENHYGPIPKDETGRTYEIHHIDGNHDNNAHTNLKAVTIKEHYDIHYAQGDWAACLVMSERMNMSIEERSYLSSTIQKQRLENGTHHFLDADFISRTGIRMREDYANGTHPFTDPVVIEKAKKRSSLVQTDRYVAGTHQFLDPEVQKKCKIASKKATEKSIEDGTHYFLDATERRKNLDKQLAEGRHPSQNKELQRKKCLDQIANGTHPWMGGEHQTRLNRILLESGKHPSQIKKTCPNCNKTVDSANYSRWHGANCRKKI
jgi:hypothetical protein